MADSRPVFQPKPGRSKVQDVTKQLDRHTQLAALVLKAEQAPDSLERMLAVCRVLFCWLTDVMRPGKGFQTTPVLTLGYHALSHRDLAERQRGELVRVYLQEAVSYEPDYKPTQHAKYSSGMSVARFQYAFTPVCSAGVQRVGILGGGGGPYLECALEGTGELVLERHAEHYIFALPYLIFTDPLAEECPIDLDGLLEVRCSATGLSTELRFKPFRNQHVKGYVTRLAGEGSVRVAAVSGAWGGSVEVQGLMVQGEGTLFDPSQFNPPMSPTINLADPGPRAMPRLWAAILQALTFISASQAGQHGRKAGQLAQQLPSHLRRALAYEVEEGPKPSTFKAAASEVEGAAEGVGAAEGASALPQQPHVPPCLRAQATAGRAPHYFLQYLVQAIVQE